jgi:parvulin-like peptidyl-prolyl isomerase
MKVFAVRLEMALCIAVMVLTGCAKKRVVAEVLGHAISAEEFQERYWKYHLSSSERDNILVREKILNNVINEYLIYDDLHRQGFDRDSVYDENLREITGQALLDGYAKRISTDTLTVSEAEFMEEFRASNTRVNARYVYAKTEDEAHRLKERLTRGETFEAIAREVFQDSALARNGGSLGFFGYGEMEPELERAAFALAPGELSEPVRLRIGYAVLRVDKRVEKPLSSEYDYAKAKPKLEKAIRERKTLLILRRDNDGIVKELSPEFDDRGVEAAHRAWVLGNAWTPSVIETMQLPDSLARLPMMRFRGGAWTVAEFLKKADLMRTRDRRKTRSTADLKEAAVGLATRDVLLEHARSAGLIHDARVQAQVQRVRDDYMLRRWRSSVLDTLGPTVRWNEDTLRSYYEGHKDVFHFQPMVNVAEIIVKTEAEAAALARRARAGSDFAALARQNSMRRWSAERGGELGFGTRALFGNFGEKFFKGKIGQILGPEPVEPFYAVFKILGAKPGRPKTYDESRDEIISTLLPVRQDRALRGAIESLRASGRIRIDMQELGNIVPPPS